MWEKKTFSEAVAYCTRCFIQKRNAECRELSDGNPLLSTKAITHRLSDMKITLGKHPSTRWNGKLDGSEV